MKYPTEINIQEVVNFINDQSDATRVYIGTDSECHRVDSLWMADYISVVVVHIDGRRGCKIFGCVKREQIFDQNKKRPAMRMMTEVRHSAELYLKVFDALIDRAEIAENIEIHLDINDKIEHGSSCVVDQAIGYIKGVCGVEPQIKPDAFSASYAADRWKEIVHISNAH